MNPYFVIFGYGISRMAALYGVHVRYAERLPRTGYRLTEARLCSMIADLDWRFWREWLFRR
jgi:hypothetical protein